MGGRGLCHTCREDSSDLRGLGRRASATGEADVRFDCATDEIVLAYNVRGKASGPNLLVCGRENVCRPVFERIKSLPSLPWLSGTLQLAYIGRPNEIEFTSINAYAIYPPTRHLSRRVRSFIDFLRARFEGAVYWDDCLDL